MFTEQEMISLLERYEAGNCTQAESLLVEGWLSERAKQGEWGWRDEQESRTVKSSIYRKMQLQGFPSRKLRWSNSVWVRAAAVALLFFSMLAGYYLFPFKANLAGSPDYTVSSVAPGENVAFLTMGDGRTVRLDHTENQLLLQERGVSISSRAQDGLIYEVGESGLGFRNGEQVPMNTISVPRGGQYQLLLPDGTKVRLNSGSRLVYPVAFVGAERFVTLSGEAYFEVAKNENHPFRVLANDTDVTVTGTQFNIAAYMEDQQVVTTLVSGGVTVSKDNNSIALSPGHQALTKLSSSAIVTKSVHAEHSLSWLSGDFLFEDQGIQEIMNSIARWYDVDVRYVGEISTKRFGGTYTRTKSLKELLGHLAALGGMRFEIDGRRVVVMN